MKRITTLLLLLSFISFSFSQEFEPPEMRFGKGLEENFNYDFGDLIEDDAAVYLFDKIDYYYRVEAEQIMLFQEYHARIKILDQDALDMADFKIRYRHEDRFQDVRDIKAASYNMVNGSIEEQTIKKKDIFKSKLDDKYSEVSFAIPNVQVGSIIEFSFVRTSKSFRPSTWYFSNAHPVVYSQVGFLIPEFLEFSNYHRGIEPFSYTSSEGKVANFGVIYNKQPSVQYVWGKTNLKPYKDEDYTANLNDFREQMQFRLNAVQFPDQKRETFNNTWLNLNKNLLEDDYADQQKDKKYIDEIVSSVIGGMTTDEEKIKALFDYVVANIQIESDGWVYTSNPVKKVLKDQSGNIADANLLLVNMLQSAGIEAYPMLISTRTDGYIDQLYPNMIAFTYPIAYVKTGEKELLLNATSKYRPYYLPRYIDYNLFGWVVKDKNPGWVDIEHLAPKSTRFYSIQAELLEDGTFKGTTEVSSTNYLSVSDRYNIEEDGVEERFKTLYSGEGDLVITDTDHSDLTNAYDNFKFSASFEIENHAQSINDYIYFSPLLFEIDKENPFTKEDRYYPVDFPYPRSTVQVINVKLPEGYTLEEAPQPIIVNFGDMASIRIIMQENFGQLQIQVKEDLKATVIEPEFYNDLKTYTDKVIEEMGKQVTLVKKQ